MRKLKVKLYRSNSRSKINALTLHLDPALSTIGALESTIQNLRDQNRTRTIQRKPYLPNVDKFDSISYHFDTWLPLIEAKLLVDGEALGDLTGIGQFYYVYLRLRFLRTCLI
jgi:hypothetical protein